MSLKHSLSRKEFFNCGFENEKGQQEGRNYMVKVYLAGDIDPKTSMIINLIDFKEDIAEIIGTLDHKFLNTDVPEFKNQAPTDKSVAQYIFNKFNSQINKYDGITVPKIELFPNKDQWVTVSHE